MAPSEQERRSVRDIRGSNEEKCSRENTHGGYRTPVGFFELLPIIVKDSRLGVLDSGFGNSEQSPRADCFSTVHLLKNGFSNLQPDGPSQPEDYLGPVFK